MEYTYGKKEEKNELGVSYLLEKYYILQLILLHI